MSGDFDGDGRSDLAVFRAGGGTCYILQSTAGFRAQQFGLNSDIPARGDYDGDGLADLAVWRPSNGTWYIQLSSNNAFRAEPFGTSGDLPVPTLSNP